MPLLIKPYFFFMTQAVNFFATIMASDHSNTHSSVQLKLHPPPFSNRPHPFPFFLTLDPSSAQTSPFLYTIKTHGQQLVQQIVNTVKSAFCIIH
jgi:hypothetical protein